MADWDKELQAKAAQDALRLLGFTGTKDVHEHIRDCSVKKKKPVKRGKQ